MFTSALHASVHSHKLWSEHAVVTEAGEQRSPRGAKRQQGGAGLPHSSAICRAKTLLPSGVRRQTANLYCKYVAQASLELPILLPLSGLQVCISMPSLCEVGSPSLGRAGLTVFYLSLLRAGSQVRATTTSLKLLLHCMAPMSVCDSVCMSLCPFVCVCGCVYLCVSLFVCVHTHTQVKEQLQEVGSSPSTIWSRELSQLSGLPASVFTLR